MFLYDKLSCIQSFNIIKIYSKPRCNVAFTYWPIYLPCIGLWRIQNMYFWLRFIFVYQKSLKPVFEYKITLLICVLVLWIYKGYCVVKKQCEMFVLKLSGIQRLFCTRFDAVSMCNKLLMIINAFVKGWFSNL